MRSGLDLRAVFIGAASPLLKSARKSGIFRGLPVYLELQQRLLARVRALIKANTVLSSASIAIEQPPDLKLGEFALPVAFELARKLRKAPKIIELAELATAG
jgi:hypothetical protein